MLLEHVAEGLGFEVARQCGVLLVFGILWGQDLYKESGLVGSAANGCKKIHGLSSFFSTEGLGFLV